MYNIVYSDKKTDSIDAQRLNMWNINKNDLCISIEMNRDRKILKKYIKKLMNNRKKLAKVNNLKFILSDYDENNNLHKEFVELVNIVMLVNRKTIYENVYDIGCDYLDSQFYGKNLCDFHNNKCGYRKDTDIEIGCCRHFKRHKQFGAMFFEKMVRCQYLGEDCHCTIKCMGCKLFTCDYLEKKGIKFRIRDIFALDSIFNFPQKVILKAVVYTPKDKIIPVLMKF